ncbi:LacI family DNA-binding transcriptional regulator [uncultured Tessaracoccus sp.]|uniref:LacI family DNA-binding transcriptional regulator n=1 Tax=uncultured Tessaracoccus sp. TaxID=905023 RepID=UPI00262A5569|nr:LacI family DNA-binding transcriptional regulator [uncultured Tessaracoccus sp.]
MAVRLQDVAREAGVSIKTVSNVVNNRPVVRPATRARVEAAIEALGYRPNATARQLRYGRSGFLALVVPQIDSPYFSTLASAFTQKALQRGWVTLLESTQGSREAELAVLAGQQSHLVDGIAFSPLSLTPADFHNRTDATPIVLLGERGIPDGFPHVAVDSVAAANAVASHFIHTGRRRIAAIGVESAQGTASVRLAGYRSALATAGLPERPEYIVAVSEYSRSAGRDAMAGLLRLPEPPDAVFCFNDVMAIGALRACADADVDVPSQVAIAGFDDIPEGEFSNPSLTTVRPDLDALVEGILDNLLGQVQGRDECSVAPVGWELIVRESAPA